MSDENTKSEGNGIVKVLGSTLAGAAASFAAFLPFKASVRKNVIQQIDDISREAIRKAEVISAEYKKNNPRIDPRDYVRRSEEELVRDVTAWNDGLFRYANERLRGDDCGKAISDKLEKTLQSNAKLFSKISPVGKMVIAGAGIATFLGVMHYFSPSKEKQSPRTPEKQKSFTETLEQEKPAPTEGRAV